MVGKDRVWEATVRESNPKDLGQGHVIHSRELSYNQELTPDMLLNTSRDGALDYGEQVTVHSHYLLGDDSIWLTSKNVEQSMTMEFIISPL